MPIWLLVFIIIASIILGLLLISFIGGALLIFFCNHHDHVYNNLVNSDNEELKKAFRFSKDKKWFYQENFFEYISIKSFDNKTISTYIHKEDSHLYIVFAHGYTGCPEEKAHCLHDLYDKYHCNILCIEQRGQTKSTIKYLTMGYKEGKDLKSWTDYIASIDKDAQVILLGESMGAATVLTGLHFNYNNNVKAVIADSSYSSIHSQYIFSAKNLVPTVLAYYIVFGSIMAYFVIHHMRTIKYSPLSAIKKKQEIPLCIIHGEIDSIVSYQSFIKFKKFINKDTDCVFESFSNTDHVAAYYTDTKRYLNTIYSCIKE